MDEWFSNAGITPHIRFEALETPVVAGFISSGFGIGLMPKDEVLESMDLDAFMSRGHMYQTEMRYYCRNLNTVEVPINYIGSKSSIRFKSVTEALKLLFRLKKNEKNIFVKK